MTDAADLVVRLLAAIDERVRGANAEGHYDPDEGGYYACPATRSEPYGDLPFGEDACDCELAKRRAEALRLCQSHRDIVTRHSPVTIQVHDPSKYGHTSPSDFAEEQACARCGTPSEYPVAWPCADLIDLARGYGVEDT